jgi:hypothetical protein
MDLKDIISISGMSGLYKVVAQSKSGFIVESLVDGKRVPVSASQRISTLGDISIYTTGDELPLREVFLKIKQADGDKLAVDLKSSNDTLKSYFKKIVPEFDEDRVYASDIKKLLGWFQLLNGKVDFTKAESDGENEVLASAKQESEKPVVKIHEAHGPKASEHAKTAQARTRKKV